MKTKSTKPATKQKAPALRKFAIWHDGPQNMPQIIEGTSAVVSETGVTIANPSGNISIRGKVMVTEPTEAIKFYK